MLNKTEEIKNMSDKKELAFNHNDRTIKRRFTEDWRNSGIINKDSIPDLITSLIAAEKEMVKYIEALHDKIDDLIIKNNICDIPSCHTANCTSDHK